jgi:hypothetical protein
VATAIRRFIKRLTPSPIRLLNIHLTMPKRRPKPQESAEIDAIAKEAGINRYAKPFSRKLTRGGRSKPKRKGRTASQNDKRSSDASDAEVDVESIKTELIRIDTVRKKQRPLEATKT